MGLAITGNTFSWCSSDGLQLFQTLNRYVLTLIKMILSGTAIYFAHLYEIIWVRIYNNLFLLLIFTLQYILFTCDVLFLTNDIWGTHNYSRPSPFTSSLKLIQVKRFIRIVYVSYLGYNYLVLSGIFESCQNPMPNSHIF